MIPETEMNIVNSSPEETKVIFLFFKTMLSVNSKILSSKFPIPSYPLEFQPAPKTF